MRILQLTPALLLAATCTFTDAKSKGIDLTGSWKETSRTNATLEKVDYKDTVRIDFLMGNEYFWQREMGFGNRGTFKVTKESLDFGTRFFTITTLTADKMVLKNDAGTYTFNRYTKVTPTTDNSKAGSTSRSINDASGAIEKEKLAGTWQTFKRTSAVQQQSIEYTRILKSINISLNNGAVTGAAYSAQRTPETGIWTIDKYENNTLYCTGIDKRIFKVLKCSEGELVLQEGDMTYFFKVFK